MYNWKKITIQALNFVIYYEKNKNYFNTCMRETSWPVWDWIQVMSGQRSKLNVLCKRIMLRNVLLIILIEPLPGGSMSADPWGIYSIMLFCFSIFQTFLSISGGCLHSHVDFSPAIMVSLKIRDKKKDLAYQPASCSSLLERRLPGWLLSQPWWWQTH